MVQTHVKQSTGPTHKQWRTWQRHGKQHTTAYLNMGHELQHIHGDHAGSNWGPSACQADVMRAEMWPQCTSRADVSQRTPEQCRTCWRELVTTMECRRCGQQKIALIHGPSRPTCRDVAPMDLTDRCRPTAIRVVPHMLERPTDHDGTIRWPP